MENINNNISFRTERLDLRVMLPDDLEQIYEYYMNNIDSFSHIIPYYNYKFDKEFMLQLLNTELKDFLASKSVRFHIFWSGGEEILGDFSIFDIRRGLFQSANLGFKLRRECRGRGIMAEALRFAIDYAFSTIGLHRLEIQTATENHDAIRLAEKLGFERVGIVRGFIRVNTEWEDYFLYSLLSAGKD